MSNHKPESIAVTRRCLNCNAALSGKYCSLCGQHDSEHVLSMRELFHELIEVLFHADSKLWRTLKLMFAKPGEITAEYVRGRRQTYTPPVRTYLVVSLVFFVLFSLSNYDSSDSSLAATVTAPPASNAALLSAADRCGPEHLHVGLAIPDWLDKQVRASCQRIVRDDGRSFGEAMAHNAPKAMFVFLPLISFIAMLLYIGSHRRYVEHLVFFIHHHTFAFLTMGIFVLISDLLGFIHLDSLAGFLVLALVLYLPLYLYFAMRRFYGQGKWLTRIKFSALCVAYVFCLSITALVAAIGTALTI